MGFKIDGGYADSTKPPSFANYSVNGVVGLGFGVSASLVVKTQKASLAGRVITSVTPKAARLAYFDSGSYAYPTVVALSTSDTTPLITGSYDPTAATNGFTVTVNNVTYTLGVSSNLTAVGTNWSLQINTPLNDGVYDVLAVEVDSTFVERIDRTSGELVIGTSSTLPPGVDPVPSGAFFVDQNHANSSDLNPGTEALPWKTIQKAVQVLTAGQTAVVKSGDYTCEAHAWNWKDWPSDMNPANSGAVGSPITFRNYPGHVVTITTSGVGGAIGSYLRNYIVWDGFKVRNTGTSATPYGISTFDSSNITIKNCDVGSLMGTLTNNANAIRMEGAHACVIENNYLHDCKNASNTYNGSGITIYGCNDLVVRYNEFYNNGAAFHIKCNAAAGREGSQRVQFYRNYVHDHTASRGGVLSNSGDLNVYSMQSHDGKYYENLFVNNADTWAIEMEDDSYRNQFFQNTVVSSSESVLWFGHYKYPNANNEHQISCYNNILYATGSERFFTAHSDPLIADFDSVFNKNCYWSASSTPSWMIGRYITNRVFTSLSAFSTYVGFDASSIYANPKFVSTVTPTDYRVQADSPCVGIGVNGETLGAFGKAYWLPSCGPLVAATNPGVFEFASAVYSVQEGAGVVNITIKRSNGSDGTCTVDWKTQGITATFGADYGNFDWTTLTFVQGETQKILPVTIAQDTLIENNETFNVLLGNPTGGATLGVIIQSEITIVDDDIATYIYPPDVTTRNLITAPTLARPAYLTTITEPTFGTRLTRVADDTVLSRTNARHHYSKDCPWNADSSLIKLQGGKLLNGNTYQFLRTYTAVDDDRWSHSDPYILYGVRALNGQFVKIDVTGTSTVTTVLRSWTGRSAYLGPWEGNLSDDDRYVVITLGDSAGGNRSTAVVYDVLNNVEVATKVFATPYDWCGMSPSGNYVVIYWEFSRFEVYNRSMTLLRTLNYAGHADMGYDTLGREVLIEATPLQMFRLSDGVLTSLLANSNINGGHVSCRNYGRPGWAYVTADGPTPSYSQGEAFAVRLDGSFTVERFAHCRTDNTQYIAEAQGCPNRHGTKFMFASSWGAYGTYPVNSYVVEQ